MSSNNRELIQAGFDKLMASYADLVERMTLLEKTNGDIRSDVKTVLNELGAIKANSQYEMAQKSEEGVKKPASRSKSQPSGTSITGAEEEVRKPTIMTAIKNAFKNGQAEDMLAIIEKYHPSEILAIRAAFAQDPNEKKMYTDYFQNNEKAKNDAREVLGMSAPKGKTPAKSKEVKKTQELEEDN